MLGKLTCAAAVPLNGRNHTYGVLEVINKLDPSNDRCGESGFSDIDIYWLSLIGITTAAAITILRNNDRLSLLARISKAATLPFSEHEEPQSTYEAIASELTGPLASYKACIIRIGTTHDNLEIIARAGDSISWGSRQESPSTEKSIYSRVFSTGEPEIVEDIQSKLSQFAHPEWIIENSLRSFACFPLLVKQRTLGTLSLYTGYRHLFDENEYSFLKNIAFLLAELSEVFNEVGALHLDDQQISDEQARNLSASRAVGHDRVITELRHSHKRFLVKLRSSLESIYKDVGGRPGRVLDEQIKSISLEVNNILDQFASVSHSQLNVNHIAHAVAKAYGRELKTKRIQCELDLSPDIPDIEASEAEIRDVIVNLVTNAIRAIEKARQRNGKIIIHTGVSKQNRRDMLEITVTDNGIGIRNEDREAIYKYGFTQYENGSGVGLYVTRGIVQNYDGVIDLESTVGKGSSFTIKLPLSRLRID